MVFCLVLGLCCFGLFDCFILLLLVLLFTLLLRVSTWSVTLFFFGRISLLSRFSLLSCYALLLTPSLRSSTLLFLLLSHGTASKFIFPVYISSSVGYLQARYISPLTNSI